LWNPNFFEVNMRHTLTIAATLALLAATGCGTEPSVDQASPSVTSLSVERDLGMAVMRHPWNAYAHVYPHSAYATAATYDAMGASYAMAMFLQNQTEQTAALKARAEAALIEARAKAQKDQAIASLLRTVENDLIQRLGQLNAELASAAAMQQRVQEESAKLAALGRGEATPENLDAVDFFLALAGTNRSSLASIRVNAIPASDFVSRGAYRVEVTPDGERVFHKNAAKKFSGGNLVEFLAFLRQTRQNTRPGSDGDTALGQAVAKIDDAGTAWAKAMENTKAELQTKKERALAQVIELVKALESATAPAAAPASNP
jgi:hypothetical protein